MNTTIKNLALACALGSAFSVYADVTDTVKKSFDVSSNSQFSLENINGEVEIISWEEQVIKVEATIRAESQSEFDRVEVKMRQSGEKVSVETDYEESALWKNHHSAQVTYKVWLPKDTNLSEIELVNGGLTIENIEGEVNAQVVNGSIKATGLTSNSEISSVNGSIKAYYQSANTDLKNINIETVNGSIKLYLPSNIDANLDIETMHGSIKTEFGISSQENTFTGNSLRGDIGSGDVEIDMESVNGSIKVFKN
jgi:DUF4097 and DUF4098 domain-containing protein YvlB